MSVYHKCALYSLPTKRVAKVDKNVDKVNSYNVDRQRFAMNEWLTVLAQKGMAGAVNTINSKKRITL